MSEKNRGGYCRTYKACRALESFVLNPDVCWTCTAYDPIFKNVDPMKFHKVLFQKSTKTIMEESRRKSMEKICTKCNEPKPANKEYFFGNKKAADGLCGWCKVCHNKSTRKNKPPVKATSKKKPIVDMENWNLNKERNEVCLLTNGIPMLDGESIFFGFPRCR